MQTAKTLAEATPVVLPAVAELAHILPSLGGTPDGRQWVLLAVPPNGRGDLKSGVRHSANAVCLRDEGGTHAASAACAKFCEIAIYHARVAAGGSVRLTSALVLIVGAVLVGLTAVAINGAYMTAVPASSSKPDSSRRRLAFVDRLKGMAITGTCKSNKRRKGRPHFNP
jgi:hypothetical protein